MDKEIIDVQSTEQETVETQTDTIETPVQEEKTFTQKELNGIVEKRLKRERERMNSLLNADSPEKIELNEKEKNLVKRELQLDARDLLVEKKFPISLLEVLNYESRESCEKSIEVFGKIVMDAVTEERKKYIKGGPTMKKSKLSERYDDEEDLSQAFGL